MNNLFSRLFPTLLLAFGLLFPLSAQAQTGLPELPPLDSLDNETVYQLAAKTAEQSAALNFVWNQRLEKVLTERQELSQMLENAKQDTTIGADSLQLLQTRLKTKQKEEKSITKDYQKTERLNASIQSLLEKDTIIVRNQLPKLHSNLGKRMAYTFPTVKPIKQEPITMQVPVQGPAPADTSTAEIAPTDPVQPQPKAVALRYDPKNDPMMFPPPAPCQIAVELTDKFTGSVYRETQKETLFTHTAPLLKNTLDSKDHIRCESAIASEAGQYNLLLRFTIRDPRAKRNFGGLPLNSDLSLLFTDGTTIRLQNAKADEGNYVPEEEAYFCQAKYPLDRNSIKKLEQLDLDKIRVAWAAGFEDYDVYWVDRLMSQLQCLNHK